MAVVNKGTKVRIPPGQVSGGFAMPTVDWFADFEYKRELVLEVLKSAVENADKAITLANILDNPTVGINKQVTDIVTADFIALNTTTVYAELTFLGNNIAPGVSSGFYTNVAVSYVAKVTVYVKSS